MSKGYNHLCLEQRKLIEFLLNDNKNFSEIQKILKIDRTTISKEVKRNFTLKFHIKKTACLKYKDCSNTPCNFKRSCYVETPCPILSKPPYVCNACSKKWHCTFTKKYYFADEANNMYLKRVSESKKGVDIKEDQINDIEKIIVPLLKNKKQTINQLFNNHPDILFISKSTFYRYIDLGVLSLCNLDLPKKVKFKPRKNGKNVEEKRDRAIRINRTYNDFNNYIIKYPNSSIVEMDTVEGTKGGKVFLTLFFRKTSLMLIFLLENKTSNEVIKVFNYLKNELGIILFKKIFQVILTDNGNEFSKPLDIELDLNTGNKMCRVFYCDPYCSWQKPNIERNHEFIRIALPKNNDALLNSSFDNLTKEQVKLLENNINNVPRAKLNNETPYSLTVKMWPDLIYKLNIKYIKPDNVDLSDSYLKENL